MKIAVCVKQIPDPAAPYELDPDTHFVVRPDDQVLDAGSIKVGMLPEVSEPILVDVGDELILTRDFEYGSAAPRDALYRALGGADAAVDWRFGTRVEGFEGGARAARLTLADGGRLDAGLVVNLAKTADITTSDLSDDFDTDGTLVLHDGYEPDAYRATRAWASVPSDRCTVISVASAITWWFVRTSPSASTTKSEPVPGFSKRPPSPSLSGKNCRYISCSGEVSTPPAPTALVIRIETTAGRTACPTATKGDAGASALTVTGRTGAFGNT